MDDALPPHLAEECLRIMKEEDEAYIKQRLDAVGRMPLNPVSLPNLPLRVYPMARRFGNMTITRLPVPQRKQ